MSQIGTFSEIAFEEYCHTRDVIYSRISESNSRQADYFLDVDNVRHVVEVKEIVDLEELNHFECKGWFASTFVPGDKLRLKINDSKKQLQNSSKGVYPAVLVVCDLTLSSHLSTHCVTAAMFGQIQMTFEYNTSDSKILQSFLNNGKNKSLTKSSNTTISCVCVLRKNKEQMWEIDAYENPYAKNAHSLHKFFSKIYRYESGKWIGVT